MIRPGSTQRVEYAAEFDICERGDDHSFGGIVLNMLFDVTFGTPETGRSGPPEHYDPSSGDEVRLVSAQACDAEGALADLHSAFHEMLAQQWLARNEETIISEAFEQARAGYERAMEFQAEQRAEMRGMEL